MQLISLALPPTLEAIHIAQNMQDGEKCGCDEAQWDVELLASLISRNPSLGSVILEIPNATQVEMAVQSVS